MPPEKWERGKRLCAAPPTPGSQPPHLELGPPGKAGTNAQGSQGGEEFRTRAPGKGTVRALGGQGGVTLGQCMVCGHVWTREEVTVTRDSLSNPKPRESGERSLFLRASGKRGSWAEQARDSALPEGAGSPL